MTGQSREQPTTPRPRLSPCAAPCEAGAGARLTRRLAAVVAVKYSSRPGSTAAGQAVLQKAKQAKPMTHAVKCITPSSCKAMHTGRHTSQHNTTQHSTAQHAAAAAAAAARRAGARLHRPLCSAAAVSVGEQLPPPSLSSTGTGCRLTHPAPHISTTDIGHTPAHSTHAVAKTTHHRGQNCTCHTTCPQTDSLCRKGGACTRHSYNTLGNPYTHSTPQHTPAHHTPAHPYLTLLLEGVTPPPHPTPLPLS